MLCLNPYDHPWFVLQGFTAITRALYQYSDPEFEVDAADTMHKVGHQRVESFRKPSGTVIPLGFFLDPANSDLSAVFFNPRETVSKLVIDPQRSAPPEERVFAAWYMASTGAIRRQVDVHPSQYHETLADGGYLLLNPYATRPIDPEPFLSRV